MERLRLRGKSRRTSAGRTRGSRMHGGWPAVIAALLFVFLVAGDRGATPVTRASQVPGLVVGEQGENEESEQAAGEREEGEESEQTAGAQGESEEDEELEASLGAESLRFRHQQQVDENGEMPPNALVRAAEHIEGMKAAARARGGAAPDNGVAGLTSASWQWLGPGNIGGRILSILIDPATPTTMWVGSATGGIFKTTDGGATWNHLDDFLSSLAISSLVSSPSVPGTIYAATGENTSGNQGNNFSGEGNRGAGVFKSTDGGANWSQLASTTGSNWWYTNRLAVHPSSASTLLAATSKGIFRTVDGGATWPQRLSGESIQDVYFDPTNGANAIAGGWNGHALYSTDGGVSWFAATGIPTAGAGRVEVAYAASNPGITYASVDLGDGAVYRSTDGGHSYTFAGPTPDVNYLGGQGDYGNALWVSPTNPDRIVVGGVDLFQSTNQGATLTQISDWRINAVHAQTGAGSDSAHADHHAIVGNPNYPTDPAVYFGTDGGIFKAANVTTVATGSGWQELNNNLGITQFYGAAGSAASGKIFGGTQDNGSLRFNGATETWNTTFGGDGGYSAVDTTNANYLYGEYVYGEAFRSSNGGVNGDYIDGRYWNGSAYVWKAAPFQITDAFNRTANFIAPLVLDPGNPQRLLVGGRSLWRTNDARTANTSTTGPTWASIKPPCACGAGSSSPFISAIDVDDTNSNLVYVGHNNGIIYRSTNATAASPTWTRVDLDAMPARMVLGLKIDPTNPNVVYAMFGGFTGDNVWRLSDGNTNWVDRTGSGATGLPDVPARTLVVNPSNANWLYVGTELGIFASEDAGVTWHVPQDGPANVPADEMFMMGSDLVAATFGRGVWRATPSILAAPGAPTLGPATGGNGSVTLAWAAPASNGGSVITGYKVYRGTVSNGETLLATLGVVTGYNDLAVVNGTTYYYKVTAVNGIGEGGLSNELAVTPKTVPGVPTGVSAVAGNGQATVSWTAPASNGGSAITGFVVTPFIGAVAQAATTVGNVASTPVTGLANGTAYTFKVAATNVVGTGAQSAASNAVTPTATAPGVPTGVSAVAGDGQATVSWAAPASNGGSPVTNYVVTPFIGAVAQAATTVGNVTSTPVTGLANGTAYTFKVAATNAVGTGTQSAASNAVTPTGSATVPGAPSNLTAISLARSQITLVWTDHATNETGFRIERSWNGVGDWRQIGTVAANVTTYTHARQPVLTLFFYRVRATNATGDSAYSNVASATTLS